MIRVCFQKMIRSISSTVRTFWETNICGRYLVQKCVWYVPNEANEFVWASCQNSTWIKPNGMNFQRKCIKCVICDSFQKFYAVDISSWFWQISSMFLNLEWRSSNVTIMRIHIYDTLQKGNEHKSNVIRINNLNIGYAYVKLHLCSLILKYWNDVWPLKCAHETNMDKNTESIENLHFLNKITEFFLTKRCHFFISNKNILIDSTDDRLGLASLRTAFTTSI